MIKEKYDVKGMSCAACVARVEKAAKKVDGVKDVSVNLLTNSMVVEKEESTSSSSIIRSVQDAGYDASLSGKEKEKTNKEDKLEDKETPKLIRRLIISVILLIPLFYISMAFMNGWPLGEYGNNPWHIALTLLLLSLSIMIANYPFFTRGFKSLFKLSPNMDSLVALGSSIAFIYSIAIMFMMGAAKEMNELHRLAMGLSFETAGMVPTLITIGKTLESYSKGKTTSSLKSLMDLSPKTATLIKDNEEIVIPADQLKKGDVVAIKPGEKVPSDGRIIEGSSSLDESLITGESIPVDKTIGNSVYEATFNTNGYLKVEILASREESTVHKIIEMVESASSSKAKAQAIADKVAGIFVPIVLGISLIVFIAWMIFGKDYVASIGDESITLTSYSIERAISILVISCPCALGLATPVAIMVGTGIGAKNGILFKTASILEETGKVDFVVLDKTGTITKGQPEVESIIGDEEKILRLAYALESKSEHPLAKAIINEAKRRNIPLQEIETFESLPGFGLKGKIDNKEILAGNKSILEQNKIKIDIDSPKGKTAVYVAFDGVLLGIILISDQIKDDSKEAISAFNKLGVTPIMLTGDNESTASEIAKECGIEYHISNVKPGEKANIIKALKNSGKVMMIGDGINDSVALSEADVGVAIGKGADVAIDSAEVVLMHSSLMDAVKAINLSRKVLINIKENLFWAFIYNLIMIPIAAGALSFIGISKLKPWYGAAAMSLSSVTVVLNALRLNLCNINKIHTKKKIKPVPEDILSINKKEVLNMKKTLKIEGMMCMHCVAHVKAALEKLEGVSNVDVNLNEGNATIETTDQVKDDALKQAITDAGYELSEIK